MAAVFFGAAFLPAVLVAAVFLAAFFGAAFLAAVFFGAAFFGAAFLAAVFGADFFVVDFLAELFVAVFFLAAEVDFLPLPETVVAVFFFAVDFVVTLLLFAAPDALAVLTAMALPGRHKGPVSSLFDRPVRALARWRFPIVARIPDEASASPPSEPYFL